MYQYKTIVTDYEGMQEALETYGAQGWKLISVGPDTWRLTMSQLDPSDILNIDAVPTDAPNAPGPPAIEATREYMASYYLLVFERAGPPEHGHALEAATETLGLSNYSLSEYS